MIKPNNFKERKLYNLFVKIIFIFVIYETKKNVYVILDYNLIYFLGKTELKLNRFIIQV